MAYLSHSSLDHRTLRTVSGRLTSGMIFRSALVAVAAAAAVLALSEGGAAPTATTAPLAVKSARIAPVVPVAGAAGQLTVDQAARTTTVEKGTVSTLSPAGPWASEVK